MQPGLDNEVEDGRQEKSVKGAVSWHKIQSSYFLNIQFIVISGNMIQEVLQSASFPLFSIFVPALAASVLSAIVWVYVRLTNNDTKKPKYKELPGPRGWLNYRHHVNIC
jgi:hypothetical protein